MAWKIAICAPRIGPIISFSRTKRAVFLNMARAKRNCIPGCIWHITHRCHKREFILKFVKDRHRYLQWLYKARKRYGLTILWGKGSGLTFLIFHKTDFIPPFSSTDVYPIWIFPPVVALIHLSSMEEGLTISNFGGNPREEHS